LLCKEGGWHKAAVSVLRMWEVVRVCTLHEHELQRVYVVGILIGNV
jgi:hypothetical protein